MDFVDNQRNARAGAIRGRAIFDNKNLFLLPGTFGHLRLFGGNIAALLIPDSAIVSDQASKIVFTVAKEFSSPRRQRGRRPFAPCFSICPLWSSWLVPSLLMPDSWSELRS